MLIVADFIVHIPSNGVKKIIIIINNPRKGGNKNMAQFGVIPLTLRESCSCGCGPGSGY